MKKSDTMHPLRKVIVSFLGLITVGTVLLLVPGMAKVDISFIDALFTSTSAVCVTGLVTLNTATDFYLPGKIVITMLIQLGALGIMTFSLSLFSLFKNNISLKWRDAFNELYSGLTTIPTKAILSMVVLYTFTIEGVTALLLFLEFSFSMPLDEAAGHAIFHAVSAFCNAGFSTFPENLTTYTQSPLVLLTISGSIILGGLGFIVLYEFNQIVRKKKKKLSLHSRIVLITTGILLAGGTVVLFLLEYSHTLNHFSSPIKLLVSFFHSVSCRTAGFNSIDIGKMRESSHFFMLGLMLVGGSPGSIAGGIKTTTIAIVMIMIYSKIAGHSKIHVFNKSIDEKTVHQSMTLLILSFLFISLVTFVMLIIRNFDLGHSFISVLFESVSAFGTVGLSMGITPELPVPDKLVIIVTMLVGRLGPLTLITAIVSRTKEVPYEYPSENIIIG